MYLPVYVHQEQTLIKNVKMTIFVKIDTDRTPNNTNLDI